MSGRPIRILHGAPDNYALVALCRAFVAGLTKVQKDAKLIEYPDAYQRDPTVAYNEAASSQAHAFIRDFLVQIFD